VGKGKKYFDHYAKTASAVNNVFDPVTDNHSPDINRWEVTCPRPEEEEEEEEEERRRRRRRRRISIKDLERLRLLLADCTTCVGQQPDGQGEVVGA